MITSDKGIEQIKSFEGFRSIPYKDVGGKFTVGYGHLMVQGDGTVEGSPITMGQATSLLKNDLKHAESTITMAVKIPLEQHQFDALVSFVFNVGSGAFQGSTLLQKLNGKDYVSAADEFLKWDKVNGEHNKSLGKRRFAERACFIGGTYVS